MPRPYIWFAGSMQDQARSVDTIVDAAGTSAHATRQPAVSESGAFGAGVTKGCASSAEKTRGGISYQQVHNASLRLRL